LRIGSGGPQYFLLLGGAAALTILSIAKLPPPAEIVKAPSTPFDRNPAAAAASDYRLFQMAAAAIPAGATVSPVSQPRNAVRETSLGREAVGLLPRCRVLPAAAWDTATHLEDQAKFLIVAGPRPSNPPGDLVLETPEGTVWRRRRP
jgi:hypothetical protein